MQNPTECKVLTYKSKRLRRDYGSRDNDKLLELVAWRRRRTKGCGGAGGGRLIKMES